MLRRRSLKKSVIFFVIVLILVFSLVWVVSAGVLEYRENEPDNKINYVENLPKTQFVLMGVDKGSMRTDVIIYGYLNGDNQVLKLLQIPRDTKLDTARYDKKINSAYGSGKAELVLHETSKLLELDIQKYILVDFEGFRKIVDLMGGVKMNIPMDMEYTDVSQDLKINLQKGEQILDGEKAEMLVRYRQGNNGEGYPEGDIGRLKIQKEFLLNMAEQFLNEGNRMNKISAGVTALKHVETNLTSNEIMALSPALSLFEGDSIEIYALPGVSKYENTISYFIPDKSKTRELITNFRE